MTTIYIMWWRQMIRYVRSPSRIIGALAQPLLYMVALGFGLGAVFRAAGQGDYISFIAPGIIGMSILFTSIFAGMELIWDKQFGFLKETLAAPVSRFSIMIGRTAGGATVAMIQGAIVLVMAIVFGFRPDSWLMILPAFAIMFLVAMFFTALGTWFATTLSDFQGFQLIMNFLVMPMFFLSGAIYPLDDAPAALRGVALIDPLSYGVDAMRAVLINTGHIGLGIDLIVLGALTLVVLALGGRAFSRLQA